MAGNAVIGALRVNLGLDSAQFSSGLKKAEGGLARFGKSAGVALAGVASAAALAGAALGIMVKGAIDHADELGKTAQKAGVTVEALSRLEYAAKLSDVSLDGLATGLRKLSQNMTAVAQNSKASVATAFTALGISVKDAAGNLRAGDEVLGDVADRFSRMEDGALKTSLAVQIFGKSGADLIPLLNEGRDGLKGYADEADRLGITLTSKTTEGAERFNDSLTKIGAILEGVANKVMEAALPALNSFADTLASPAFADAAQTLAVNVLNGLNKIIDAIVRVINYFDELERRAKMEDAVERLSGSLGRLQSGTAHNIPASKIYDGMLGSDGGIKLLDPPKAAASGGNTPFKPLILDAGAAKKALIELTDTGDKYTDSAQRMTEAIGNGLGNAFSRLADAVLSGNDALSATVDVLMDLGKQLVSSAITGFFGNLFSGALSGGMGLGSGAIGRGVYGGNTGFFPGFPGLAGGTDNWRGGMTWVGEKGPELLNLPRGSQVIPNHELRASNNGPSVVRVDLGPGLVGAILKQAGDQAVQIVQTQAPLASARARFDRKGG